MLEESIDNLSYSSATSLKAPLRMHGFAKLKPTSSKNGRSPHLAFPQPLSRDHFLEILLKRTQAATFMQMTLVPAERLVHSYVTSTLTLG
ncbi:hypothetical protein L596_019953 [Steinernema carpocapsae]|uniref:Uncharacterized protein n=1 Tax=Steinernema carpocapsae TaxID=34508 RepID=A0A4U5MS64_STECR|nr:hypothetical protein L596_019953 [Steinernema carpocapsae]